MFLNLFVHRTQNNFNFLRIKKAIDDSNTKQSTQLQCQIVLSVKENVVPSRLGYIPSKNYIIALWYITQYNTYPNVIINYHTRAYQHHTHANIHFMLFCFRVFVQSTFYFILVSNFLYSSNRERERERTRVCCLLKRN